MFGVYVNYNKIFRIQIHDIQSLKNLINLLMKGVSVIYILSLDVF